MSLGSLFDDDLILHISSYISAVLDQRQDDRCMVFEFVLSEFPFESPVTSPKSFDLDIFESSVVMVNQKIELVCGDERSVFSE